MLRTVAKETEMLLLTVIYGQEKTEVDAEIHGDPWSAEWCTTKEDLGSMGWEYQ